MIVLLVFFWVWTDVDVLLFGDSSQIECLWHNDRVDTTIGMDCDSRSNFSAAVLALMLLLAEISALNFYTFDTVLNLIALLRVHVCSSEDYQLITEVY